MCWCTWSSCPYLPLKRACTQPSTRICANLCLVSFMPVQAFWDQIFACLVFLFTSLPGSVKWCSVVQLTERLCMCMEHHSEILNDEMQSILTMHAQRSLMFLTCQMVKEFVLPRKHTGDSNKSQWVQGLTNSSTFEVP